MLLHTYTKFASIWAKGLKMTLVIAHENRFSLDIDKNVQCVREETILWLFKKGNHRYLKLHFKKA